MSPDHCPDHDRYFSEINAKLTEILVRLERGSGVFEMLNHRLVLLEQRKNDSWGWKTAIARAICSILSNGVVYILVAAYLAHKYNLITIGEGR